MRLGLLLLPASAVASALPTKPDAFSPARHLRDLLPIRRLADVSCTILSDVDYAGNDIGSVAAAAAGDCCATCGATSGCGAFTWTNWNGGTCWLKSKQGTATVSSGARSAVVATSTTPGLSCTIEAGVDYVGNDIANVPGAAPSDCCAKCKAQSGCNAFSWINYNGGTCYLKSSKGSTQQKADVYSGVVSSSGTAASCPTVQTDVNYVGNDVASVAGTGASDCCTKCAAQSGCGAFTWTNWNGGTCWLKSGKGATQASTGAISAVLSTSGPTCPNVEQGVDYVGNDVASVAGSGASDCCTKCAAQAGCGAFTWSDWNGGTCWLKSGKGATKTTTGVVSAVLGGSLTPVTPPSTTPAPAPATCAGVESDVNYNGNDVGSAPAASASECCAKCGAFSGCFAFTWTNYNNGTCWLKSMKGESAIALGAISGYLVGAPTAAPVTLRPLTPRPTTSKPAPSSHVQWKLRAGVIPARSANLGGWLVGEYWMSYASPAWKGLDWNTSMSGEYYAMQKLGASVGTAQFEAHRQTWITESDIAAVAAAGLNCVRVPIGFWIVYDDPSIPPTAISKVYAPGSLKYLDTLINVWAVKYNIAVMISLHAHQGSQNGNDHSAPQVYSRKDWSTSQANVDNSLQFATFIAARYKNSEAFLGMNLMNEPSLPTSYDVLLGYYTEAYKRIRATGNDCIIVTSPMVEQQNADVMVNFMRPPEYYNVWHELHPYFKWGYEGYNEQQVIKAASGYRSNVLDKWVGNPLFLGEWSLGSPEESAPFKDRTLQKQYAAVQLANYEAATSGWSFWAWRNDQELNTTVNGILVGWSMRQLLQEGIFTVPRV